LFNEKVKYLRRAIPGREGGRGGGSGQGGRERGKKGKQKTLIIFYCSIS
jgi:hypothetical protein